MSKVYDVVLLPGDGIGKPVLDECVRVLEAAGFKANWHNGDIGWEFWRHEGNPLPDRTVELLTKYKLGLFGAITSKPKDAALRELDAELQDTGLVYASPIVGLRQKFNLDVCIRPCLSFEGNPLNFIRRGSKPGEIDEPKVDVVIFRQNTEGLYSGVEWTNPQDVVYEALKTHPKFKNFETVPREDLAVSARIFSRGACQRILRAAFEHADKFGYKSVTICEKPNVIRETSGMMLSEGKKIQKEFPHIVLWDTNIDAQMMWLTKNPEDYGVIVAGNMFGDIVSDGFAGLVGGLGFACSANLGDECAVFEPTHGSAPKYADYPDSIVNPIAMILSGCMMLDHIGELEMAKKIRKVIAELVKEGKSQTYDMMKLRGAADVMEKGAASTRMISDAIIAKLEE
jgi:isocitrate/isopropylmalate dehydrogenase